MTRDSLLGNRWAGSSTYIKLSLVAMIWGGTFVAGRYISGETPPLLSACLRFLLAGGVLALYLLMSGQGFVRVTQRQLFKLIGLGFCGIFAYNLCFFYGLHYISASRASLIVALNPAVMAIVSYLMYREYLPLSKVGGIVLCVVGAGVVLLTRLSASVAGTEGSWVGDLLIFGCVLSWVAFSIFGKTTVKEIGALHTVTYSILAGAAMLTATAMALGQFQLAAIQALPLSEMLSLVYLGVMGSAIAYIWYYNGIQKIGATRAGVFIALNPLTAVLLGGLLLNEVLSGYTLVGGVLIIGGIVVCNRPVRVRVPVAEAVVGTA
jgi:drug/metabolite transporter (DMT)-like permease